MARRWKHNSATLLSFGAHYFKQPCLIRLATTSVLMKVPRVMYGTGGHDEMPRGMLLEVFQTHADIRNFRVNRLPKVIPNSACLPAC